MLFGPLELLGLVLVACAATVGGGLGVAAVLRLCSRKSERRAVRDGQTRLFRSRPKVMPAAPPPPAVRK